MNSSWLETAIAWIQAHPNAAGLAIFLVAFFDSLILAGIVVPALPLLIAIGTMVGMGHINPVYAIVSAALGALVGDGLSYWVGRRWGSNLLTSWPFNKYPTWIEKGEQLFKRRGVTSILIARFVGAIRPFVPAIAGMAGMPLKKYLPISFVAALLWSVTFLAPGMLLGASYDAVAAVADRLAILMGGVILAVGIVVATVLYVWRWSAEYADIYLARILAWSKKHPRLGRFADGLVDPNRPESASLLMLAVCLMLIGWAWFALLSALLVNGGAFVIDHTIHDFMWSLRNPLADDLFGRLASIGDTVVLASCTVVGLLYLAWRRRWEAVIHWIIAVVFGVVLTQFLAAVINIPSPASAPPGFGFPAKSITMTTIVLGFFAVLIAREYPSKPRVWPYVIAGILTTLVGIARLYLGAHWPSDLIGGALLGLAWVMIIGLAYRAHHTRGFWMRPLTALFYGTFAIAAVWHMSHASRDLLQQFHPAVETEVMTAKHWNESGWKTLPARRVEADARSRWDLNFQYAGSLEDLSKRLQALGYQPQEQATWVDLIGSLDTGEGPAAHKILPASFESHPEALLLSKIIVPGRRDVIRLWPTHTELDDKKPLWIGNAQTMMYAEPYGVFGIWRPTADSGDAFTHLYEALEPMGAVQGVHPGSGSPVLRLNQRETSSE